MDASPPKFKRESFITMGVLLLAGIIQLLRYYQIRQKLSSPFIPQAFTDRISLLHAKAAIACFTVSLAAYVLYRYSYYKLALALSIIGVLSVFGYLQYAG